MFRSWRLSALSSVVALLSALTLPSAAQTAGGAASETIAGDTVVITPADGSTMVVDGRTYGGAVTIRSGANGLAVVEETTIDFYLYGIAEVPFSWPIEALRAQSIAARTYLAWTLARGRSSNGRLYGYDICATDQCQVYRGLDGVGGVDGERWREAVDTTASQILLDGGRPLQALYSSTSGGRTRSVEDVFGGEPNPHLAAVTSPGEASPFASWRFSIEFDQMAQLAEVAGHLRGDLVSVRTVKTPDGGGPWLVEFIGSDGTVAVPTWELRTDLNAAARTAFPDVFPVPRPDRPDRRYPQTIMSPSFSIRPAVRYTTDGTGPPVFVDYFEVRGNGWGHLVGMSQYGAEAMARTGSTAENIVAHYYGGLTPVVNADALPAQVRVGLATNASSVAVQPSGPVSVRVDGEVLAEQVLGSWAFIAEGGSMLIQPPVGLGLPPELFDVEVIVDGSGRPEVVSGRLRSAAEVRTTMTVGDRTIVVSDWELRDAGSIAAILPHVRTTAPIRVVVQSRSPNGADSVTMVALVRAD